MTTGKKYDGAKNDLALLPFDALEAAGRVFTYGAAKYQDRSDNWARVEEGRDRYTSALLRHLCAWRQGEESDPETGESHLAHLAACALILLARQARGIDP